MTMPGVEPAPIDRSFKVIPRRWVVERTYGWLGRYRRLSKDYEFLPETSKRLSTLRLCVHCSEGGCNPLFLNRPLRNKEDWVS